MERRDRMPPIPPGLLDTGQRMAAAELAATPRGGVSGPFVPLLRSPELLSRLQRVGEYLRYVSDLSRPAFEFCVLVVARHWEQGYEWQHHIPYAQAAGIPPDVIDELTNGTPAGFADPELDLVWRVVRALPPSPW